MEFYADHGSDFNDSIDSIVKKVQDSAPIMNMVKNTRLTFTLGEALYLRYHRENGMFRRREDA